MKISVALCTYNGAKYIKEQLDSILNQTFLPNEIIICDDNSTDETVKILESYLANAKITIKLYPNQTNVGVIKNFENAISSCTGEIIFLSDQDDVWESNKVEKIVERFIQSQEIGLIFTNASLIDENSNLLPQKVWENLAAAENKKKLQKHLKTQTSLSYTIEGNPAIGATMAFLGKYQDILLPFPKLVDRIHDGWIVLALSAVSSILFLEEALIKYRQHSQQSIGVKEEKDNKISLNYENFKEISRTSYDHSEKIKLLEELASRMANSYHKINGNKLNELTELLNHLKFRQNLPPKIQRLTGVLNQLSKGNYTKFSNGLRSAIKDLIR